MTLTQPQNDESRLDGPAAFAKNSKNRLYLRRLPIVRQDGAGHTAGRRRLPDDARSASLETIEIHHRVHDPVASVRTARDSSTKIASAVALHQRRPPTVSPAEPNGPPAIHGSCGSVSTLRREPSTPSTNPDTAGTSAYAP